MIAAFSSSQYTILTIHAGCSALVLVIFIGPRHGRFQHGKVQTFEPHNLVLSATGTMMLVMGWFGMCFFSQVHT